ncbi:Ig-like domain-containing protein [Dokdonella fugitiva]|jgi:pimeloyl-ACP methyl ester carboxylesterase|uniref:Platelet-activating factor acetylhydrolase isoform II n=1 Tax=Dokdonella fugitiva TaxID=328517 RepID=A0A4R2ICV8_9GAMM|nr:Ig-like domain-containing protein [Dokdonella fugitiva]TCO41358.1 platelet-activating factor acetylhydrolase isoform II [Dokdonella fugitiva]
MQVRSITTAAVAAALFGSLAAHDARAYDYTAPVVFHATANFDPAHSVIPFPNNLLFLGTTDLTLNIPVADANDYGDPKVAMNALDGFGTTTPWSTTFSAPIDPASLAGNVRMFEVTLSGPGGAVTGVVRELASPGEFVAALSPSDASHKTLAIVPTAPLKQRTSYMAVLTNGIKDAAGNEIRGTLTYLLSTSPRALCAGGHSTNPALSDAQACQLEPLRQLNSSQAAAAAAAGVPAGQIALSWVATTQSITPTMQALTAITQASPPAATHVAPTGKTLADLGLGLPPVADIYIGTISLPYYLSAPSASNPTAPLTGFWHANAGAYIEQCAGFGLDPTSTNLTACNPVPAATTTETVPLLMTYPNAHSGRTMPAGGWPLVIFQHGVTRNRTDMFAVAGTLAAQGFAVVAIDLPLHGLTSTSNPFYVGNTPFGAIAHERTFDLDLSNNATGAPGPDGAIDPSGSYMINLTSLLTSRDNLRQGEADLLQLAHAASTFPNVDASRVSFVGQSLGSIVGTVFLANDPTVNVGLLSVPGGGIARFLEASPSFGPRIRAGLAAAGLQPGTPDYDAYFVATQTVIESGDPINFAGNGTLLDLSRVDDEGNSLPRKRLLVHEVVGGGDVLPDQVIPNSVPGAPLSGTEPLIRALGLAPIVGTVQDADGIRGATRFLQGEHGSLLDPTDFPAATVEMQGEMASLLVTGGAAVQVANPSVIATSP